MLFPLVHSPGWSMVLSKLSLLERPKFNPALPTLIGKPLQRDSMAFLPFQQSGLQCLLPYFQRHHIQGNLSAVLSRHLLDFQSPLKNVYFFGWSEQGMTPAFFKALSRLLSVAELYGMWAGALMVRNTSAHQEVSALLWACPSVSIANSSFTVFYTPLVFSSSCSTACSFRLCKICWRCLFQREFCLKSKRTLQVVQYVLLPLVWKIIWILYFSA